jgi:hypothetical protein
MNSNKTKKDILDEIDSSMKNLSNLNEQIEQFNRTKKNFTVIPDNHNRKSKSIKEEFGLRKNKKSASNKQKMEEGFSLEKEGSGYYSESSIDDKATKRVNTRELQSLYKGNENLYDVMRLQDGEKKKSSEKFTDKEIRKDGKNSQNQFTK